MMLQLVHNVLWVLLGLLFLRPGIHIDYLLTYLLTNSMQQSPSWEADLFSASQEIHHILWHPKFITAFTTAHHLSLP